MHIEKYTCTLHLSSLEPDILHTLNLENSFSSLENNIHTHTQHRGLIARLLASMALKKIDSQPHSNNILMHIQCMYNKNNSKNNTLLCTVYMHMYGREVEITSSFPPSPSPAGPHCSSPSDGSPCSVSPPPPEGPG